MEITLNSRRFVATTPVNKPSGSYVAHKNSYYPVTTGYPLAVLADAAGKDGDFIVLQSADQCIAVFPGSSRVVEIPSDQDAKLRVIARLALSARGQGRIISDVPNTDIELEPLDLQTLKLPPIMSSGFAQKRLAITGAALTGFAILLSGLIYFGSAEVKESKDSLRKTRAEITKIKSEIEEIKVRVDGIAKPISSAPDSEKLDLPASSISFIDHFAQKGAIKGVKNGRPE